MSTSLVTVNPVNDPPVWKSIDDVHFDEDTSLEDYITLTDYVTDVDTRLSLYQSLVKADNTACLDSLTADFRDRFGEMPREVTNLLYFIRLKILASKASIESITTEEGQIVVRRFQGMPFDRQKLQPFISDGMKLGVTHLYINPKRRKDWQKTLEEVVGRA